MTGLPRSTPSAEGVDPAAVLALVDALDGSEHEPHSLMILRHGRVIAEGWWAPYRAEHPQLLYSLSKSLTSMAVGLAIDDGLLDLDDRLVDLLPGFGPQPPHERVAAMTLRHALTMTTGHDTDPIVTMFPWIVENPTGDWLDGFFELVPDHDPGWPFTYNQLATHAAARAVEARTGRTLLEHLRPRLLEPLGAADAMTLTAGGHALGFAGMFLRTESIAAFGRLCLDRGRIGDRRIIAESWIDAATTEQVPNDAANRGAGDPNPDPDWNAGYGYQFWRCRHGFRGDGALGQFCIVWPDEDVVIATTAAAPNMQAMLDVIEEHLGSAFDHDPDPQDRAIEIRLGARCADLELPVPEHDPDAALAAGTLERVGGDAAPSIGRIAIDGSADRCTITLARDGDDPDVPLRIVPGGWADGEWPATGSRAAQPVAVAGGVGSDGGIRAEIVLVQTPHRLILDADPGTGGFTLSWNRFPLHGAEPSDLAPHSRPASFGSPRRGIRTLNP